MAYRKVGYLENGWYIVRFKLKGFARRFKLWLKPNKKCRSCCLACKHFNKCSEELL